MNFQISITLLCACLLCSHAFAAEKPNGNRSIAELIALLADQNFSVREEATMDLWKLGAEALAALKSAAADEDPEKSMRARDIARRIELGITPDTNAVIIDLVGRYDAATPEEKVSILGKLKNRRAWHQVLKLYAMESSEDVRADLESTMDGVALKAAREAIAAGDAKSAREFLELGPADDEGLLSLADFLRDQNLLDQELKKLPGNDSKLDPWKLALLRAAGNASEAGELAKKLGFIETAALMAVISGDPLPWLKHMQKEDGNRITAAYADMAARSWNGEVLGEAELDVFTKTLDSKRPDERDNTINALHALGKFKLAEPALIKTNPLIAFQYFDMLEKPDDAMRALGLKADASDGKSWVSGLIAELEKDNVEDQREPSTAMERLTALAYFNERRGLHDRNDAIFTEPITVMSEKNPGLFLKLVGNFFGRSEAPYHAAEIASRMASKWAGQNPKCWEALVAEVLGDEDVVNEWWEWLAELDPESSPAARFDAMLVIFKIRNDPKKLREKFIERLWEVIDKSPEEERVRLLARMVTMAIISNDLTNNFKALDRMPEKTRDSIPWESRLVWLTAVNRWDEAASLIISQLNDESDPDREPNAEIHAYAASSLRRAGRSKEAEQHDRLANQLVLGEANACLRVANGYAFGGEYKTAAEWWRRALIYANPKDDQEDLVVLVRPYADDLLERSDWSKSAAAFEMLNSIVIAAEPRWQSPIQFSRMRLNADMSHALSKLNNDHNSAIQLLEHCHRIAISDGSLADYFFPALRKAGLKTEHDKWFRESWDYVRGEISRFPEDDHLRNTAAWFASRAARELETAEKDIIKALALNPDQAAYLDTMAEIQFAKGNRAKAVEWSNRALELAPADDQIRRQSARFRSETFPVK